jgi:thioredoxin
MRAVVDVTDSTFTDEVLRCEVPVMLDLWADWCEPCKQLDAVVEELARAMEGRLKVCRVDVACNPRLASRYHVMSVPTLLFMRSGQVVGQHLGPAGSEDLRRKLEDHLGLEIGLEA